MSDSKIKVLFYHAHFFNGSETFIYQQAINPYIQPVLLAKKFLEVTGVDSNGFTRIQFKRSWWDGLISNLLQIFFIDRYYQRKSILRIADLVSSRQVEVLHAQFGFSAIRILPVAKKLGLPLIVSFHGLDASRMLRKRTYRNGLKQVFGYASAIVVCNPAMAEVLPLTSEQQQKVVWIPYGINIRHFSPLPKRSNPTLRILHVGRLIDKKGVPDLIRAFAMIQSEYSMQLDIVGTGPEEDKCRKSVLEGNIADQVVFHGWKSPQEVMHLMQASDVFVLNSRVASNGDSEGLPVGILEAMAMALPVVSTRHAAIPEAVGHLVTGILVKERDTEALAHALSELVNNESLRLKMGRAGRARIESFFTMEQMHERLKEVYRDSLVVSL